MRKLCCIIKRRLAKSLGKKKLYDEEISKNLVYFYFAEVNKGGDGKLSEIEECNVKNILALFFNVQQYYFADHIDKKFQFSKNFTNFKKQCFMPVARNPFIEPFIPYF